MNIYSPSNSRMSYLAKFTPHGFELSFAVLCVLLGVSALVTEVLGYTVSAVQALPTALVTAWAAQLVLAGGFIHTGLLWPQPVIGVGMERAGLMLAGTAWLTYLLMALNTPKLQPLSYMIAVCFIGAVISRMYAISRLEAVIRANTE